MFVRFKGTKKTRRCILEPFGAKLTLGLKEHMFGFPKGMDS